MEKIQTGFRGILRLLIFIIVIIGFAIVSICISVVMRNVNRRRFALQKNVQFFSGVMLAALGLKLNVKNAPMERGAGSLIVSNHMGFVDILILASVNPVSFITSNEMKNSPGLGLITKLGGCVYVERRSRVAVKHEMKNLANLLREGFDVVLYPEATSSGGDVILPFKRGLMMAAAEAGVPIRPVVINFTEINGEDFNTRWRDSVCWYGDLTFVDSFWGTLTLKSVSAEIEFLDIITVKAENDRKEIAETAYKMISSKFRPVRVVQD